MLRRTNTNAAVAATPVFMNASVLLNGTTTISHIVKRMPALYPINSRFGRSIAPTAMGPSHTHEVEGGVHLDVIAQRVFDGGPLGVAERIGRAGDALPTSPASTDRLVCTCCSPNQRFDWASIWAISPCKMIRFTYRTEFVPSHEGS